MYRPHKTNPTHHFVFFWRKIWASQICSSSSKRERERERMRFRDWKAWLSIGILPGRRCWYDAQTQLVELAFCALVLVLRLQQFLFFFQQRLPVRHAALQRCWKQAYGACNLVCLIRCVRSSAFHFTASSPLHLTTTTVHFAAISALHVTTSAPPFILLLSAPFILLLEAPFTGTLLRLESFDFFFITKSLLV